MNSSFVFILSFIDFEGDLPFEIIPNHFLQKANADQIIKIKSLLNLLSPDPNDKYPYEYNSNKVSNEDNTSSQYRREHLPQNEWRYWVISFKGYNTEIHNLQYAASLLKDELELGFIVIDQEYGGGFIWNNYVLLNFYYKYPRIRVIKLSNSDLQKIGDNYTLIKKIDTEWAYLTRAFQRFNALKHLPNKSELMVIGLFLIIESLVTHNPNAGESGDSLKHQIKTKMPLLGKRFERSLDYKSFFGNAKIETIWSKLYDYRSEIVHGEQAVMDSKFSILKDHENIISFLHESVKLLLLSALKEPTLLRDLKEC